LAQEGEMVQAQHQPQMRRQVTRTSGGSSKPGAAPNSPRLRQRTVSPSQARTTGIQPVQAQQQPQGRARAYSQPRTYKPQYSPRVQSRRLVPTEGIHEEALSPRKEKEQEQPVAIPSAWAKDIDGGYESDLLGGGAFANIYRVRHVEAGQDLAIKVMYRPNFTMRGIDYQVKAEVEAMKRAASEECCHHVCRLYDAIEENDYVYLLMEACKTDLLRYTNNLPTSRLPEREATTWLRQCLLGLRELHGVGILHRDIKPENLLLTADWILKIADFGWCADVTDTPSSLAGTFLYMAPEMLGSWGVQTEAVDVWSAGVTFFQLLLGRTLLTTYLGPRATQLSETDPHAATKVKTGWLLAEIQERCPPAEEDRPAYVSWVCWDLFRKLLVPELALRPSVSEALGHQCLREVNQLDVSLADDPPPVLAMSQEADSIASELRSPRASQRQQAAEVPFVEEVHLKVPVKLAAPTCRALSPQSARQIPVDPKPISVVSPMVRSRNISPAPPPRDATVICMSPELRAREMSRPEEALPRRAASVAVRPAVAILRARTADVKLPISDVIVHTTENSEVALDRSPMTPQVVHRVVREQSPRAMPAQRRVLEAPVSRSSHPQRHEGQGGSLQIPSVRRMSTTTGMAMRRISASGLLPPADAGSIVSNGGSIRTRGANISTNGGSMQFGDPRPAFTQRELSPKRIQGSIEVVLSPRLQSREILKPEARQMESSQPKVVSRAPVTVKAPVVKVDFSKQPLSGAWASASTTSQPGSTPRLSTPRVLSSPLVTTRTLPASNTISFSTHGYSISNQQ